MTARGQTKQGQDYGRHPAKVTSDRLLTACQQWRDKLSDDEQEALLSAHLILERIAEEAAEPRELLPCGTVAAYQRHKRRGETPCEACKQAHAADLREWRQGRQALR
jgi:hypothetical protein